MKPKLLVIDTETGGLDPERHSILSLAAVIYQEGAISGTFKVNIREYEMLITDEARHVNGIDSTTHEGSSPWHAMQLLINWMAKNELYGQRILVGHNVAFDIGFLKRLIRMAGADFHLNFSHRSICTQSVALLLEQADRLDLHGSASLDNVAKSLGLPGRSTEYHDCLEDAILTAKVLKKLVERIK